MLQWVPTIWLGFVALRYGVTAFGSVGKPFTEGWDIAWTIAWLGALLVMVLLNRLWWFVVTLVAIVVIVLSHAFLPALTALIVIVISAGLGEFALHRLGIEPTLLLERLVVATSIGIGCLALGQLGIAALHFFYPLSSWCLILTAALPAYFGVRRLFTFQRSAGLTNTSLLLMPIGYLFLLNLMWASAPEIQFDPLNVHLAVPRLYLQNHGLIDLPYFFHSYFAHLLDMIFGLCLALGGPLVAKFLVLDLGLLSAASVFVLGRALFTAEVGAWASLIFYSTPLVIWLSSTTYLDLPLILFIVSSVIAFIRWHETSCWAWFAASGWIAGVAVGTKIAALTILAVFPVVGVAIAWRKGYKHGLRLMAAYTAPLVLIAVPWYLVVYLHTGNPFFPFLNAVFQSPQWPIENTSLNAQDFGIGTSAGAMLRLPFRLTFNSTLFGEALPRGALGVALLLGFPLSLVFMLRGGMVHRTLLAAIGLHLSVWTLTFQYGRYYLPVLPFLVVVGCGVFALGRPTSFSRWNQVLLLCCVLSQVPVASIMFWNVPERFPIYRAMGFETDETFLGRALPAYNAARFLNTVVQPGEKVLGIGVENTRFYLNAPLYLKTEIDLNQSPYALARLKTDSDLAAGLVDLGLVYLFVPRMELGNRASIYPYARPEFLERFGRQLYADSAMVVFRISSGQAAMINSTTAWKSR